MYNVGMNTTNDLIEKFTTAFRNTVIEAEEKVKARNKEIDTLKKINDHLRNKLEESLEREHALKDRLEKSGDTEVTPREQALIDHNERLIEQYDALSKNYTKVLQKLGTVEKS